MRSDSESTAPPQERLEELRERIIAVDDEIIRLIGERRTLVLDVGRIKESLGLPVLDPAREARVVRRVAERSRALGVDEELTRDVIWRIISSARQTQSERGSSDEPPGRSDARPGPSESETAEG
jgi:chorismate mutase